MDDKSGKYPQEYGDNPDIIPFNITVSVPAKMDIKLVDVSDLGDYELWAFISSLLSNIVVGMWVWLGQNEVEELKPYLLITNIIFTILFIISLYVTYSKRRKFNQDSTTIPIK